MPREKRWNYLWDKLVEHVIQAIKKFRENDEAYRHHVSHIPMIIDEIKEIKET